MARRRKNPEDKRHKWPVLNVTEAEKKRIAAAAAAQGLAVNQYILAALEATQVVSRSDWRETVRVLCEVSNKLTEVSDAVRDRIGPPDVVRIDLALLAIERHLLSRTMPWLEPDVPEGERPEAEGPEA